MSNDLFNNSLNISEIEGKYMNLNKKNKNKKIIEEIKVSEKNFKKQQKVQKELMKKTQEIMNESIIRKNDCIKSIIKFYE